MASYLNWTNIGVHNMVRTRQNQHGGSFDISDSEGYYCRFVIKRKKLTPSRGSRSPFVDVHYQRRCFSPAHRLLTSCHVTPRDLRDIQGCHAKPCAHGFRFRPAQRARGPILDANCKYLKSYMDPTWKFGNVPHPQFVHASRLGFIISSSWS